MKKSTTAEAKVLMASDKPVLIDFFADWCGPCKMLAPIVEELASEYSDKINIIKINIDEEELAKEYGIMSIPTLIVFKNGEAIKQVVGFQPKAILSKLIDALI